MCWCQVTRLHLVDLAGSENFDKVSTSVGINFGLLALGKVLMALDAREKARLRGEPEPNEVRGPASHTQQSRGARAAHC